MGKKTPFCEFLAFLLSHTLEDPLFHSRMVSSTKLYPQNFSQASGSVWDLKVTSGTIPVSLFSSGACDKSLTPDKILLSSTPGYLKCLQTPAGGSIPFECVCVSGPELGTVILLISANPHSLLRGSTLEGSAHPPHPLPSGIGLRSLWALYEPAPFGHR